MSKTKWYQKPLYLLVALALVLSLGIVAVPTAGTVEAQAWTYLGTPPTIDGDLSEWEAAGTQYIYTDGCLGGDQIGTGKLYMAFDDDNFYLAYKLEIAPGDNVLYAFNGGFWFPDPSAYDSSENWPSQHVLTATTLELRQSWAGVRGAGAVYGEWCIEIVSNNAARIIRLGSMQATTGLVTDLDFYAGSYDGEGPFPGSYITDGVDKDLWILTGFNALDPHFGQYSVAPPPPTEVWVDASWTAPGGANPPPVPRIWGYDAFATIQDGIDAVAGSTVNVAAGTYNENLIIDKSLSLLGEDKATTTIQAAGNAPCIYLKSPDGPLTNVTVKGFSIINTLGTRDGGIYSDCKIDGLLIEDNNIQAFNGIWPHATFNNATIRDNNITEIHERGILVEQGSDVGLLIEHNIMTPAASPHDVSGGIYIQNVHHATITRNTISGFEEPIAPLGRGISGSDNDQVTISNNTLDHNQDGITMWVVHDINITGNQITNSGGLGNPRTGTANSGINIKGYNLQITGNTIENNVNSGINVAQYSILTHDVDIHYNNIVGNGVYGVRADGFDGDAPSETVDATCNWWGSADGPSGIGPGSGDAVSANVHFDPWLKAPSPYPLSPMASFVIDHAKIDFKKKVGDDKVRVSGKLELDTVCGDDVDISEDVIVTVGPLSETITMVEKGKKGEKWEYKRPKHGEGNIKKMTIDWKNGKFDIRMDKAELTGMTNPVTISIQIGDDLGEETILMREKKHHWDYKAK